MEFVRCAFTGTPPFPKIPRIQMFNPCWKLDAGIRKIDSCPKHFHSASVCKSKSAKSQNYYQHSKLTFERMEAKWLKQQILISVKTSSAATATKAPSTPISASPATSTIAARLSHGLQLRVDLLLGLVQDLDEVLGHLGGLVREERHRHALGASTPSAADAVDVVLDVVGPAQKTQMLLETARQ